MNRRILFGAVMLAPLILPSGAMAMPRQAAITGDRGGYGTCTAEVDVDGAAELEISGDNGWLRTLSGGEANWRRFQCNEPLPRSPTDFRLAGINGRGTVRLLRDPRNSGGRALIHITDPQGGRGGYTLNLQWRRTLEADGPWPGNHPPPGRGPGSGSMPIAVPVRACQDAVTDRLNREGYPYVSFDRTVPEDGPGRKDWVMGSVSGKRGYENARFTFSCSVDFSTGRVRSVDVNRRWFSPDR